MARSRLTFLPVFFSCLGVALAVAIVYRIQSYPEIGQEGVVRPSARSDTDRGTTLRQTHEPKETRLTTAEPPAETVAPASPVAHSRMQSTPMPAAPPSADAIEAIWFDPRSIRTGRTSALHVRFGAGVDARGVRGVRGVLLSTSTSAAIPFACAAGPEGVWDCAVDVPSCIACGRWVVDAIEVESTGNQVKTIPVSRAGLPQPAVQVYGERCDTDAPTLHAASVESADGDTIIVRLTIADTSCGVAGARVTLAGSGGASLTGTAVAAGDEDAFACTFAITRSTPRGRWQVGTVDVFDQAGNHRTYTAGDPLLKDAFADVP